MCIVEIEIYFLTIKTELWMIKELCDFFVCVFV